MKEIPTGILAKKTSIKTRGYVAYRPTDKKIHKSYAVVFMPCSWRGCHKGEVRSKRTPALALKAAIRVSSSPCQPRVETKCCRAIYAVLGPGLYAAQKSVLQFFRGLEISWPVVLL